jgi:hypothetical protein
MTEELERDILSAVPTDIGTTHAPNTCLQLFILTYECTVWTKCGVPVILKQEMRTVNAMLLWGFSAYDTAADNATLLGWRVLFRVAAVPYGTVKAVTSRDI